MMMTSPEPGSSPEPSPPTKTAWSDAGGGGGLGTEHLHLSQIGQPAASVRDVFGRTTPPDLSLDDPDLLQRFDRARRIFRLLGSVNGLRLARAIAMSGTVTVFRLAQRMPDFPPAFSPMLAKMESLGLITLKRGTHWDVTVVAPTDLLLWMLPAGILSQSTPTVPPSPSEIATERGSAEH